MPAPTGIDYYQALAIPKTASREQIQKGYRATALKTHPLKTASDATQHAKTLAQVNFQNAAEAYQVLSDPKLRAIYDQYGLDGLKVGVPAHGDFEGYKGHYEFNGNAEEVFELFFGSNNPFQDFNPPSAQADGSLPSAYYGEAFQHLDGMVSSMIPGRGPTQDQAREIPVEVSLEELFAGATKKLTYKRQVLQADKSTLKEEEHTLTVEVTPGAAEGTKITFARQGDQGIKKIATDIVAVLRQQPHPHFQREGQNLVYKHAITLEKALTGSTVSVPLLAGRSVNISLQEIISPTYRKVVAGEGLPLPWVNGQPQLDAKSGDVLCGDLILTFDVTFPTYLSVKQKEIIKQVFAASS